MIKADKTPARPPSAGANLRPIAPVSSNSSRPLARPARLGYSDRLFLAGNAIHGALGLTIPGNILGLFLLLALLALKIIRLRWIEEAAATLLWLLPLLFLPIFVGAGEDRRFWTARGPVYGAAVLAGLLALWAFVGHLAQFLFRRSGNQHPHLPGPLTDAERHAAEAAAREVRP